MLNYDVTPKDSKLPQSTIDFLVSNNWYLKFIGENAEVWNHCEDVYFEIWANYYNDSINFYPNQNEHDVLICQVRVLKCMMKRWGYAKEV